MEQVVLAASVVDFSVFFLGGQYLFQLFHLLKVVQVKHVPQPCSLGLLLPTDFLPLPLPLSRVTPSFVLLMFLVVFAFLLPSPFPLSLVLLFFHLLSIFVSVLVLVLVLMFVLMFVLVFVLLL